MEKKGGICTSCHQKRVCSIKTGVSPSWDCSEYQSDKTFLNNRFTTSRPEISAPSVTASFKGLCASCELTAGCHWIQPDTVIFHCEHYQ